LRSKQCVSGHYKCLFVTCSRGITEFRHVFLCLDVVFIARGRRETCAYVPGRPKLATRHATASAKSFPRRHLCSQTSHTHAHEHTHTYNTRLSLSDSHCHTYAYINTHYHPLSQAPARACALSPNLSSNTCINIYACIYTYIYIYICVYTCKSTGIHVYKY